MLIATVTLWALVGVAGVAMAAALILRSAARLLPERRGSGSWMAWLVICAGAVIEQNGDEIVDRSVAGPVPAAVPARSSSELLFSQGEAISPDHRVMVTPGRMVCCLCMRFLC